MAHCATAEPAPNAAGGWVPPAWLAAAALVLATALAYQPVWHAGFIWDDDAHLTANPCIVGPVGFWGIWTSSAATYYPLVLTTFWVEHAIWGLQALPYHLVNVGVHAACGVLLWRVLRQLRVRGAWLGAALWTLHPVQVESAAWVTELKNTQSCFFYLLAILIFVKWRQTASVGAGKRAEWLYALTLLCALMALLSKASTVMLPVVLGLCWWWLDGQWRWRNVFRLVPLFLVSAVVSAWTIWEQKYHSLAQGAAWTQSLAERVVVSGRDVWFYLGKLLWPHPLIFIYPRWTVDAARPPAWLPVLAAGAALLVLWLFRARGTRAVFFAFAYFLVSLFPAMDFFNVYFFRYSFVGDHFQYLAAMGPLALAAAGLTTVWRGRRWLGPALGGALLLTLGALTWSQCHDYRSLETLWRATLARNPDAWMAHNNLASVMLLEKHPKEALAQIRLVLAVQPDLPEAYYNYGDALVQEGKFDEAIARYQKAIALKPNYAQAEADLGFALLQKGETNEALLHYQAAVKLDPGYAVGERGLAFLLSNLGAVQEAIPHFGVAALIDPTDAWTQHGLGLALLKTGRAGDAILPLLKSVELDPQNGTFKDDLGQALFSSGLETESMGGFIAAAQKDPAGLGLFLNAMGSDTNRVGLLNNLAWSLATNPDPALRNGKLAVLLAARACETTGYRVTTMVGTLAAAYAEAGRYDDAVATGGKASALAAAAGQTVLMKRNQELTALYRMHKPYHEPAK